MTRDLPEGDVLDATSGMRSIWHDENKYNKDTVYCDIREKEEGWHGQPNRHDKIDPDVVADYRDLPFDDESFDLICWDPPHITTNRGMKQLSGYIKQKYGALHAETWQTDIRCAFQELWRVLRPGGTLTFKFASNSIDFDCVLDELPRDPMYGTTTNKKNGYETRWFTFYKARNQDESGCGGGDE